MTERESWEVGLHASHNKMMKILSFSYCYPSPAAPTWGVFVHQRLAAVARHAELRVVSPVPTFPTWPRLPGARRLEDGMWEGLSVYRPRFFYFPKILKSLDARFYAAGLRRWLEDLVDRWQPDLLDAHFIWPDGVGVSQLARELDLPYTITLRGKLYPCLDVPSQRQQCAEALRTAASVISVDPRMAGIAQRLGAEAGRIHVIPNGVDIHRFTPGDRVQSRKRLGLPTNGCWLVSVGHLGERKGHRETIRAMAKLPRDIRLLLVGGDSSSHRGGKRDLLELAQSLGVSDRVVFAGRQPFERIPLYYQAADASVLASWREGCPNVVLESLACGVPVIATDVGSTRMMIQEGRNGRIVPPRDVDRLAESIKQLLDQRITPEKVRHSPAVRSWDEVALDVCGVLRASAELAQGSTDCVKPVRALA